MKRKLMLLPALGLIALLILRFPPPCSSRTGAPPAIEAPTFAPTYFSYLPLVRKVGWTPTSVSALGLSCIPSPDTGVVFEQYVDCPGNNVLGVTNPGYALEVLEQIGGWKGDLWIIDSSLTRLEPKINRMDETDHDFIVGYGPEEGEGVPPEEWDNLTWAIQQARALADEHGKLLVFSPTTAYMWEREDLYPILAPYADIWMIRLVQFQMRYGPGDPQFRADIEEIVGWLRAANPGIRIWVQLGIRPKTYDHREFLRYREQIVDLIEGVYVEPPIFGDPNLMLEATLQAWDSVCGQ